MNEGVGELRCRRHFLVVYLGRTEGSGWWGMGVCNSLPSPCLFPSLSQPKQSLVILLDSYYTETYK